VGESATQTAKPGTNVREYTVSELSFGLKKVIEGTFDHVRVRGEIGRVSRPGSGHVYLDLKDDRSVLAGVIWKGVAARLPIQPEQGLEVVATGKLTTFPGQSKYQIVIDFLEPAGVGALMALLEERKKKLAAEGLFDEARKRPLPFLPRVIGIVTSPTGAVIRDMMHGFSERFPVHVIVWPVRVQGEQSAGEVAKAIQGFNKLGDGAQVPRPDVLIVARGGGSLEDLWGFNEEAVVRAVAESEIPVVSAVGHETDWTLIDLVADARAPTPTKAAEWAVPRHFDLLERMTELGERLRLRLRRALDEQRSRLKAAARGLPRPQDLVALPRQRLDSVAGRLGRGLLASTQRSAHRLAKVAGRLQLPLLRQRLLRSRERLDAPARAARQSLLVATRAHRREFIQVAGRLTAKTFERQMVVARERLVALDERRGRAYMANLATRRGALSAMDGLLNSLSHQSVLERGFALVRDNDGQPLRRATEVERGDLLELEFVDGRVGAQALETQVDHGEKAPVAEPNRQRPGAQKKNNQGSLF